MILIDTEMLDAPTEGLTPEQGENVKVIDTPTKWAIPEEGQRK